MKQTPCAARARNASAGCPRDVDATSRTVLAGGHVFDWTPSGDAALLDVTVTDAARRARCAPPRNTAR